MGDCMSKVKGSVKKNVVSPSISGPQPIAVNKNPNCLTIALVGLDNAGKTTLAKSLKGDQTDDVTPTVGFSSMNIKFGKYKITMFDLGGGSKIRGIWRNYFAEIYGLIYVLDSSDQTRLEENIEVLTNLLQTPTVQGKPILLFLNKQDVPGALDENEATDKLNLENLVNTYRCPTRLETCSAVRIPGRPPDASLKDGFQWLLDFINSKFAELSVRVANEMTARQAQLEEERIARLERIKQARRERGEPEDGAEPESDEPSGTEKDPFKTMAQIRTDLAVAQKQPLSSVIMPMSSLQRTQTTVMPQPESSAPHHSRSFETLQSVSPAATPIDASSDSGYKSAVPNRPKTPAARLEPYPDDLSATRTPISSGQVTKLPPILETAGVHRNMAGKQPLPSLRAIQPPKRFSIPPPVEGVEDDRSPQAYKQPSASGFDPRPGSVLSLRTAVAEHGDQTQQEAPSADLPATLDIPRKPSVEEILPQSVAANAVRRSSEEASDSTVQKRKRKRKRLRRFSNRTGPAAAIQQASDDSEDNNTIDNGGSIIHSSVGTPIKAVPLTPRLAELPTSEPRPLTPPISIASSVTSSTVGTHDHKMPPKRER